ncbi:hypothetical protein [Candidatus Thioglobus sp.]|jgi:hypothetical protein|uniref:hypothetical protein n=1 Tax=Candidatus Thioglobus sp. TaxID=2026721 RepID=UPI001779796D|nr:hypothetical protein [Candidatus Thioglobus sp.]HIF47044.1 hypothetical protein [Candidatus Thioglobus sp.]
MSERFEALMNLHGIIGVYSDIYNTSEVEDVFAELRATDSDKIEKNLKKKISKVLDKFFDDSGIWELYEEKV